MPPERLSEEQLAAIMRELGPLDQAALRGELDWLSARLEEAERERDAQMQDKLDAQTALVAIVEALDMDADRGRNGT